MLFQSLKRKPFVFDPKLRDYCLSSTYESIKKRLAKNEEERKNYKLNLITQDIVSNNSNPNDPFLPVLVFLSISSFLYYFYNSKK